MNKNIILKDFDYFKIEFNKLENELNEHKTIKLIISYDNEDNIFNYNLLGLFYVLEYDCIFSTTNEKELNKILKFLLNQNYYITFDYAI